MRRVDLTVPVYLPEWLYGTLRALKRRLVPATRTASTIPNLTGDRDIEWSCVVSQMPSGPGEALDFGPRRSNLGLIAAQRGFNVAAVDLEIIPAPYLHPQLCFTRGDLLKLELPTEHFDLVIN